jgi:NAD(P)-dependent dehydrogenase (short-subunit alcohol dehydrogenase family)
MQIDGSTFLVSGGGSGLGAATVRLLTGRGGKVVLADVDEAAGEATAAETGARFVRIDVTDEAAVRAAVDAAVELGGGSLHGAVSCAGIGHAHLVVTREGEPYPIDAFRRVVEVNLIGTFNVIRLAAAAMRDGGVIVNTASVAAFDGQIGQAAYSASKGGIVGMTLPIARDLARRAIRVVTIAPGIFDTPLLGALPEEARASLGKQVPFPQRLGHPGEYAALVGQIVENDYLNGETIRLDGAIRMAPK